MGGPHGGAPGNKTADEVFSGGLKVQTQRSKAPLRLFLSLAIEEIVVQFPFVKSDFLNIHYDA